MISRNALLVAAISTVALSAASALPAHAHHAFAAEYDIERPITLKGKVTKLEWVNPHGWMYIDVVNPKTKKPVSWAIEFGGPNQLLRQGVRKTDFPMGVDVTVQGYLAKNGQSVANGTSVVLPDGRNFYTGSSGGPGEPVAPARVAAGTP